MIFRKLISIAKYGRWIYGRPGIGIPGNFSYTVIDQSTVNFTWTAAENALGYKIYDESDQLIADVGNVLSWQETGYILNETKIRKIRAYNGDIESDAAQIEVTVVMPIPSNFQGSIIDAQTIEWSWSASEFAEGYRIYDENNQLIADVGNVLSWQETGLDVNVAYTRKVTAYNGAVETNYSQSDTITIVMPAPTLSVQSYKHSKIVWEWTASNYATGYRIYDENHNLIADVGNALSHEDLNLEAETTYTRYVKAYSVLNKESDASNTVSHQTAPVPIPQNFAASVDSNYQISFYWEMNDPDIDGFKIYDSSDTLISDIPNGAARSKTVSGFSPNTEFTFKIIAYYKSKISGYSNTSTVITYATTPSILSLDSLNNIDAGIRITVDKKDNPDGTIYEIYCFTTGETIYAGESLYYDHRNLDEGMFYQYQVRAKNSGGVYTGYSNITGHTCTYPTRIQLAGGLTQVFNTSVNLELFAPDGYTAGMIITDSVRHGNCELVKYDEGIVFDSTDILFDYHYQDTFEYVDGNNNYQRKDIQSYVTTLAYVLPSRHCEIELSVVFMNNQGEFTPPFTTKVTYFKSVQMPEMYLSQSEDGVVIEGLNLRPGGYGTQDSVHTMTGVDKTYVPNSVSGFIKNLFVVVNGNILRIFDYNWNCLKNITLGNSYNGICYDSSQNCLWLSTTNKIEKWILVETGRDYDVSYTGTSFTISQALQSIATDCNYVYGVSLNGYVYRWSIIDGVLDGQINISDLSSNSINNKAIEYWNGYLYVCSSNGYMHVIDITAWPLATFACEINTNLSTVDKICTDGFYMYVSKGEDLISYRYTLSPRIDVYKSYDNVNFSLIQEDASIKTTDSQDNNYIPPAPILSSTSHTISVSSADTTVDITIQDNPNNSVVVPYYYIVAHDTYGHFSNPSSTDSIDMIALIDGYSVVWDTSPDTIPPDTINEINTSITSSELPDGEHYIHVRTIGANGVAGETAHLGPFKIDTAIPNVVGVAITPNPVGAGETFLVQVAVSDL